MSTSKIYKVRPNMDDNYLVVELIPNDKYNPDDFDFDEPEFKETSVFDGGLADCEAWIRLHEGGYM